MLIILICFPPVGDFSCEILLAQTIRDAWLSDLVLIRLIPVMITRMIISLKKSASKPHMDMEAPSAFTLGLQDSECTAHTAEGIPLSVIKSEPV